MAREDARTQFRAKFRLDELTVHETDDWTLSVRPGQPVLGAMVLSARHEALDFSQAAARNGAEMLDLMARVEAGARDLFGAVRLNALCLMMQDPLFHFHLLPRYRDPVVFAGHEWVDSGWPGPPNLADNQAETDEELAELRQVYSARAWQ